MTYLIGVPAIAGLAIGIIFIVIISMALKPAAMMTDNELSEMTGRYPQVMALKERYVNTIEQIERADRVTYVHYVATKEPMTDNDDTFLGGGPKILAITVEFKHLAAASMYAICGSGLSVIFPATVQAIKTSDCLETP